MNSNKVHQFLGICKKAGKLVSGEFAVKKAVLEEKVCLVIIAKDASENTKKLFKDKTAYRKMPCIEWGTKEEIAHAIGKEMRVVVGITDLQLATKLEKLIKECLPTKGEDTIDK